MRSILVALVVAVACSATPLPPTDGCPVTPETAGLGVLGRPLAKEGPNTLVAGSVTQTIWHLRSGDLPEYIQIRAERRDAPWAVYDYYLERTQTGYPSDFRIDEPGCWGVRLLGSANDEIVLRVEPARGQRASRLPAFAGGQRPKIRVGGNQPAVPGCGPIEVADAVTRLFAAYSEGNGAAAGGMLVPYIHWFTFTRPAERGGHVDIGTPSAIAGYIAKRHAQHERLALTSLDLNGPGGGAGSDAMNVGYEFEWSADDGSGRGHGKGALECPSGKILVWSMGEA